MTTPTHYGHFPSEFEPYKICNNANFNGNLQQIFQYVARRKHKGNEIGDLKKALDFVRFEEERRVDFENQYPKYGFSASLIADILFHAEISHFLMSHDLFVYKIYYELTHYRICTLKYENGVIEHKLNYAKIKELLQNEITRLETLTNKEDL